MNKIVNKIKSYHKIIIILLILSIDYLIKSFILNNFTNYTKIKIFKILNIIFIKNYGLIFGLYENEKIWNYIFFNIVNIIFLIILILLIYYFYINKTLKKNFEIFMFISGFIGNTIDRIKYGYIIDFFDLHYKSLHFPTFNISDINIVFGYIIFFYKNYL